MKTFLIIVSAILGGVISSTLVYIQNWLRIPDHIDHSAPMYLINMLGFMPSVYFPFGVVLGWAAAVAVMAIRKQEYHTVGKVCFWSGTINFLVLVIPVIISSLSRSRGGNINLDNDRANCKSALSVGI